MFELRKPLENLSLWKTPWFQRGYLPLSLQLWTKASAVLILLLASNAVAFIWWAKTILAPYFLPFLCQRLFWLHKILYFTLEQSHTTPRNHCSVAVPNPKGRAAAQHTVQSCHPCCLGNFWNAFSPVLGGFLSHLILTSVLISGHWKTLPS